MKINFVNKAEWRGFVDDPRKLMSRINDEIFIVRHFMQSSEIDEIKGLMREFSSRHPPSWHPCVDGCPDYHRVHNLYPQAYVKSVQHAYYFHPWNSCFSRLRKFADIDHIFELKATIAEKSLSDFMRNLPSQGPIVRIVCHQYPPGGGGQAEHVDPVSPFAKVQTIIQASDPGVDYQSGGFYINHTEFGLVNVDPLTSKGDLILVSPGIKHGVSPIDPSEPLDWDTERGRWIIMPIIIHSDHSKMLSQKPQMTTNI
jgi:hypothetical protein